MSSALTSSIRITIVDREFTGTFAGPSFRPRRPGPEEQLLDRFLREMPIKITGGCDVVVFREPRLPCGFPDLVIVIWDRKKAARWSPERANLASMDLQLAHYLHLSGPSTLQKLQKVFAKTIVKSIERLAAAGILRSQGARWVLQPLRRIFAAREIIAVEAKINKWKTALMQAELNTWFASSSYVLVPEVPKRSNLLQRAKQLGIGISTRTCIPMEPMKADPLPRSYASWLFNEWAWRVGG